MTNKLLTTTASALLLGMSMNVIANEMSASSWNFPTPDQIQVAQNRGLLFCDANPYQCPVGLRAARAGGGSGGAGVGSGSLVGPTSNASANNISVVVTGDHSSVTLSTDQEAQDNNMTSNSDADADIELDQVLNYENNYK
ncbi:MAG: hypothetical protein KAH00_07990 [Cocleimonas sp.]|nr:hypothetical protein [Cocleimonas sp.]